MFQLGVAQSALITKMKAFMAALTAHPIAAAITVVVGLAAAMWALHDGTTAQEYAQKQLNDLMESTAQKKEEIKNKISSLISVIQDETQSIYEQIKAYKELQKYDGFREKTRAQIANMSDEEKNKITSQIGQKEDFDALNAEIEKTGKKLKELNAIKNESTTMVYGGGARLSLSSEIEKTQAALDALIKKQEDLQDTQRKAAAEEYEMNMPIELRSKLYQEQIVSLEAQKKRLEDMLMPSGVLVDSSKDLSGEWWKFNGELLTAETQLGNVVKQLNEAKGKFSLLQSGDEMTTYAEAVAKANDELGKAREKMKEIESNGDKFSTQDFNTAKENLDKALNAAKDLGIDTTDKQEKARQRIMEKAQREAEQNRQQRLQDEEKAKAKQEQIQKEMLDMIKSTEQQRIDLMDEGTQKRLAQIDYDFKQQVDKLNAQKKEWESAQKGVLTTEQTDAFNTASQVAFGAFIKGRIDAFKESADAEAKAMNEYLIAYGTYEEKRLAITEKYSKLIAEAKTEGEKKTYLKEQEKDLADLGVETLKQSAMWKKFFTYLDGQS
jgi:hypothetical protein